MSPRNAILASSLAALIGAGALLGAPAANAYFSYQTYWSETYPDSLSDNAASDDQGYFCALCHNTEQGNGFNDYGNALRNSTAPDIFAAFAEVEPLNSDLDPGGCTNLQEITASTQPGWTVGDLVPPVLEGNLLDPESPCGELIPDIDPVPTAINFGSVPLGETSTGNEISVNNVGDGVLTVTGLTLTGDPVFNLGQNTPTTPFDVAPGGSVIVGVTYTPTAVTVNTGALEIASNDPDESLVVIDLTGAGTEPTAECAPVADPSKLDFGQLVAGEDSLELTTTVTNFGTGTCDAAVSVPNCVDGEFTLTSPAAVTLDSGASTGVSVVYAPINVGIDDCRIDFNTQQNDLRVPMTGEGVPCLPTDMDINNFRAQANTSISRSGGRVVLDIIVQNNGDETCTATLTVTGEQNGVEWVQQVVQVSDSLDPGATRYRLQTYFATEEGVILWTATLDDADPDDDVATATTTVRP